MGRDSNSGHYEAYVSDQPNWLNFDDDYVTEVIANNTVEMFNRFQYLLSNSVLKTPLTYFSTSWYPTNDIFK